MNLPRAFNVALKRCSENRDLYFAQSAATRGGRVATLPVARSRSLVPLNAGPSAVPSPSPKADGSAPFTHGANA